MTQTGYSLDTIPKIPGAQIAVIQSKWHRDFSNKMVEKCLLGLEAAECEPPDIHIVPGCFEIPLAAHDLAKANLSLEAIIVFGILIKGDTYHFEMVMEECVRGIGRVILDENIPIINEILPVTSRSQLEERCGENEFNKGFEAAIAAAEMISWRRSLKDWAVE